MAATEVGEWVPISEAAQRLRLSQDAVRRRLKGGQLQARREVMPQGFRWLVLLAEDAPGVDNRDPGEVAPGGASRQGASAPEREVAQAGAEVALLQRAQEMAAYTEALLQPWRRQALEQAERIVRLEAELAQAKAEF